MMNKLSSFKSSSVTRPDSPDVRKTEGPSSRPRPQGQFEGLPSFHRASTEPALTSTSPPHSPIAKNATGPSAAPVRARSLPTAKPPAGILTRDDLLCAPHQARLARDVYNYSFFLPQGSQGVAGWRDASEDSLVLAQFNLNPLDLQSERSTFRARLYVPDTPELASLMPPQLVFRGTEPTASSGSDWKTNISQVVGLPSDHYSRAAALGRKLPSDARVFLTGHSLGGGLASVAALTSGKPTTLFNSVGLNASFRQSLGNDGKPLHNGVEIREFHVQGEWLTATQRNSLLPKALGLSVSIQPPKGPGSNRLLAHRMDALITGLEKFVAQEASGTAIVPLHYRVFPESLPPFGYCHKTPNELNALLKALACNSPPKVQKAVRKKLGEEAEFVLRYAERLAQGGQLVPGSDRSKELMKELRATELLPQLPPDEAKKRLAVLVKGADEVLRQLTHPET